MKNPPFGLQTEEKSAIMNRQISPIVMMCGDFCLPASGWTPEAGVFNLIGKAKLYFPSESAALADAHGSLFRHKLLFLVTEDLHDQRGNREE